MQDGRKAVWRILYVSVEFFPSLKHNFIACRSSKVSSGPDCIFEIQQLWQSGFSRVYSNCCCSFESEIIEIGQLSHKMYNKKILNFQEFTTFLNAHTKKVWKLIVSTSYIVVSKEGDQEAHFSIATTLRCCGGRYSFPRIAPLYPRYVPYIAGCIKYHF